MSNRIHISVEWSGNYLRLSGYSRKATERLGKKIIEFNEETHRKRSHGTAVCVCSVLDITRLGATHADYCPVAN